MAASLILSAATMTTVAKQTMEEEHLKIIPNLIDFFTFYLILYIHRVKSVACSLVNQIFRIRIVGMFDMVRPDAWITTG
jgi:hypothetical protein